MAHTLTAEELARIRNAFANWDLTGVGTIRAGDVRRVMGLLGETLSDEDERLLDHPYVAESRVSFDDFLVYIVGPPSWEITRPDPEKELSEAIAAFDDGQGYAPLRECLRIVREHMEKTGSHLTDGDLIDVCRQAIDGSWFATAGESSVPGSMWKVLEEEFAGLRKGQRPENIDSGRRSYGCGFRRFLSHSRRLLRVPRQDSGIPAKAGVGRTAGEMAHMINVTVVDLGGTPLMFDAVASTWSVQALQQHIESVAGVPVHRQFLWLVGKEGSKHEVSPDDSSLSKAGVVDGSTLLLAVKEEIKLDYKRFVSTVLDVEFEHALASFQNLRRRG